MTEAEVNGVAQNYYAFTLADVRDGKVAFLAGDGVATGDGGKGVKITFKIQAADDDDNLSDSDPGTSDLDPVDVEISIVVSTKLTAGTGGLINEDGDLTPDKTALTDWIGAATTHSGTLRLIVKLQYKLGGDALKLRGNYDKSKITALDWDDGTAELRLDIQNGATEADIETALGTLWLDTSLALSASERRVWVYPILQGVSNLRYRLDEAAGLVRYYLYDSTSRSFSAASTEASGRSLFGKNGYLGVYTSDTEKSIYTGFGQNNIFLAISDATAEGKWVITAGPRKGQLFWDHTASPKEFGPGAVGSTWSAQGDFWNGSEPNGGTGENYAKVDTNGSVVDVGGGSRKSVSHHDLWLSDGEIVAHSVDVGKSPPNPVLEVDFGNVQVDNDERLVLTEDHILVKDVDTILNDGTVDASKITLRVSGVLGGTLQKLSSDAPPVWQNIDLTPTTQYREFTLADLKAGKIAFLAGDGLASGNGERITFQIQAADEGLPAPASSPPHLSDSDPNDGENDADPVDGEISIVVSTKLTAGTGGRINEDGALTPGDIALTDWVETAATHRGTLRLIVKLLGKEDGDVLSLSYDTSKITVSDWDDETDELWLDVQSGTTIEEVATALGTLWLDTSLSTSASVRRVWVYPVLEGVSNPRYRFDEAAGLVRYYLYDSTSQSFTDATTAAAGRTLFGKSGYLGVYTSDTEKSIYTDFNQDNIFLAITDSATEGQWVVTSGPREGQLFWDHTNNQFGPGAAGSGWNTQTDFWHSSEPNGGTGSNYAELDSNGRVYDVGSNKKSVTQFDLLLSEGEIFFQRVSVAKSPPNPILEVHFEKLRANADARQVLATHQILVKDADTVLSDGTVDASKITLRVSGVLGGTLESRASVSSSWGAMRKAVVNTVTQDYYAFTLEDVRAGKIAFVAGDGLQSGDGTKITFQIQAADDDDNLSDSDLTTSELDPVDGEISIVASAETTAGYGVLVNADGVLSPLPETLTDWKRSAESHGGTMRVVAKIVDWQKGDELSLEGYVESKVTSRWDDVKGELSLDLAVGATVQDMREALLTLWLDSDALDAASRREIWVFPTIVGVDDFAYRVEKIEKVVRYYFYDDTSQGLTAAFTAASGRSLFGEEGYLGVYTSDAEWAVYVGLRSDDIHLAVSDLNTEGKWLVTAGPRKGLLFWDQVSSKYGPGAAGSGWGTFGNFWTGTSLLQQPRLRGTELGAHKG